MRAWTSPLATVRLTPLRIFLAPMLTSRSAITSWSVMSGVVPRSCMVLLGPGTGRCRRNGRRGRGGERCTLCQSPAAYRIGVGRAARRSGRIRQAGRPEGAVQRLVDPLEQPVHAAGLGTVAGLQVDRAGAGHLEQRAFEDP